MPKPMTPDNFWARVGSPAGDKCREWLGHAHHTTGYGVVGAGGRLWQAHRLAWTYAKGPIPAGMFVLHRCDNRRCCNPLHLFLGTQKENMDDMRSKGRGPRTRGADNANAKVSPDVVREIRDMFDRHWVRGKRQVGGVNFLNIGRRYGISDTQVRNIVFRVSWKELP